jgi:hypothetical protein
LRLSPSAYAAATAENTLACPKSTSFQIDARQARSEVDFTAAATAPVIAYFSAREACRSQVEIERQTLTIAALRASERRFGLVSHDLANSFGPRTDGLVDPG